MKSSSKLIYLVYLFIFLCLPFGISSHAAEQWKPRGSGVEKAHDYEKPTYRFIQGYLDNSEANFKNGIIEFELKPSSERAFFYVYFRKQSGAESEVVYIRNHKSNAPDTIQYSPVYQGKSAWQLYHGQAGTASASLPKDDWVNVKLRIKGNQFSMWVGDNPEPNIKNMKLTGNDKAGGISFRGFIPRGSKAEQTGLIRNINIQHLPEEESVVRAIVPALSGSITSFKVSPAFEVTNKASTQIPLEILNQNWMPLKTDSHGKLELLKHRKIPKGVRIWAVAADTTLRAQTPTQCQLNIGFSDAMTLMLNNEKQIFSDASYRYSDRRQQGVMHASQVSVFLNLNEGDNALRAIVADSFGGWGFQARMIDCEGVSVAYP